MQDGFARRAPDLDHSAREPPRGKIRLMEAFLGQFRAGELEFIRDALDAADIKSVARAQVPDSLSSQALAPPSLYDVFVAADRLADAKAAIERWRKEAEAAVMREHDAGPASPEELAADAEWEKQAKKAKNQPSYSELASRLWLPSLIIAVVLTIVLRIAFH